MNVQGDFPTIDLPGRRRRGAARRPGRRYRDARLRDHPRGRANQSQRGQDGGTGTAPGRFRALYSRATAPTGEGPLYHHIGVYAYRRRALKHFVGLPPSPLERRERLEQLRALEAGLRIDAVLVDDVPFGVDTREQLEEARAIFARRSR